MLSRRLATAGQEQTTGFWSRKGTDRGAGRCKGGAEDPQARNSPAQRRRAGHVPMRSVDRFRLHSFDLAGGLLPTVRSSSIPELRSLSTGALPKENCKAQQEGARYISSGGHSAWTRARNGRKMVQPLGSAGLLGAGPGKSKL